MHEFLINHGYPALFFLSFFASTLIPIGSEWLLVALIAQSFAPVPVVLVASAGNFLGACTGYGIGLYGSTFLSAKVLRMNENERVRAEQWFAKYGIWSLLFSWLPLAGDPLCVVAGMMKVGFARFAILVIAGKTARYAALAWATEVGRKLFF